MKTLTPIKTKFLILLFFLFQGVVSTSLYAQKDIEHTISFKYDNGKDGQVVVIFQYQDQDDQPLFVKNLQQARLDFGGQRAGKLVAYFKEIKSNERRSVRREFNDDFKLVVLPKCIKTTQGLKTKSFQQIDAPIEIFKIKASAVDRRIPFEITKNGSGNLTIDFGVLFEDIPSSEWTCNSGKVQLNYTISGINEPEPEVKEVIPAVTKDWNIAKNRTLKDWMTHLETHPSSPHRSAALSLIGNEFNQKYEVARQKNTTTAYQDFIDYCGIYPKYKDLYNPLVDKAKKGIRKLENNADAAAEAARFKALACYKDWQKIKKSVDFDEYTDYINQHKDSECEDYVKTAKDKIKDLVPIELTQEDAANGYKAIFIKNALNPRFKDISIDGNLQVNTSRLKDENVLLVKFPLGGNYEVYVEDELGKSSSISFDNQLIARMREDSLMLRFTLEKGSQPYRIDLVNEEKGIVLFSEEDINKNKFSLEKSLLQELGATGNILVQASDNDSFEPKNLGNIFIAPIENSFDFKYIIYGLSALAFLLGGTFLFLFLRKRRQQRQPITYEEMG